MNGPASSVAYSTIRYAASDGAPDQVSVTSSVTSSELSWNPCRGWSAEPQPTSTSKEPSQAANSRIYFRQNWTPLH